LEMAANYQLGGWLLLPGADAELRLISQHVEELAASFLLTTPAWSVAQVAYDKDRTYRQADLVGIDYPRTYRPQSREELSAFPYRFPLVLKPATRERPNPFTAAKGWRVNDRTELLARYDEATALVGAGGIILQEFIPGTGRNQFSYAAIWDRTGPIASLVARRTRQFPVEFGLTSTFVETVENRAIEEAACKFLSSIEYSGLVELEFKYDERDERYKLLDFNARAWSWIGLGAIAGVDFPSLLVLGCAESEPVFPRAPEGARWMHVPRDLAAAASLMFAGTLTLSEYLRQLRRPITFAAFAWDDPLPGIMELPITAYRSAIRRFWPERRHQRLSRSEFSTESKVDLLP
jgi:predicted ATP-grasp superfamily ATP-dependent carboligase